MDANAEQAHHWEVSWAPLFTVLGVFLLLPLTFSAYFVYENALLASVFAGIGVPVLLAGIAKWVSEGLAHKNLIVGAAAVGMPIFIISEALIFLALFTSYWIMRLTTDVWPPEGSPDMPYGLPLFMTFILVSSSLTIHKAEDLLERGDLGGFRHWLMITIALGAVFLACTTYEYTHLISLDFRPSTNAFSSVFYTITGFHASHVFIGASLFCAVLIPALGGKTNHTFVQCASVYWHFVDLVWFFVVSQVYFW